MSRAPLVMGKPEHAFPRGNQTVYDTTLGWRFPNPQDGGDVPARVDGRDRRERGRALRGLARGPGRVRAPVPAALGGGERGRPLRRRARRRSETSTRDEHPRPDTSLEKLAALKPAFREGGTVTAGNCERDQRRRGRARDRERGAGARARRRAARRASSASAVAGVDPRIMGIGPVPAVRKLLERAGVDGRRPRPRRAERGVRFAEPRR